MLTYVGCLLAASVGAAPVEDEVKPLSGAVIVVDPGHGGQRYSKSYTGGTRGVDSKLTESELNLRVAFELAKLLRENGATVFMTRQADHRLSPEGSTDQQELHARIDFFDTYNPHFYLSVHHNAAERAAGRTASGHSALYKNNAKDDALYKALARDVNDALEGAVPGPKNALILKNIHILRQTDIPGMISEAGFMTNPSFDEVCNRPEFPPKEAAAICKGAIKYWTENKAALTELRDKLAKERATHPRDPKTFTATELNPDYQAKMKKLLSEMAPNGRYKPELVGDYISRFKKYVVTDPSAKFEVKTMIDGKRIKLTGEADKKYHDQLIDMLVAMKLYDISNEIKLSSRQP